jgi:hypothetical protein
LHRHRKLVGTASQVATRAEQAVREGSAHVASASKEVRRFEASPAQAIRELLWADASALLIDAPLMHQTPQHRPSCCYTPHQKSAPRAGFRQLAWSPRGIAKVDVVGSNPISRSKTNGPPRTYASGPLSFDASAYLMRS